MKRDIKSSLSAGFTIVETMIVLAIASLMLLLVFEAIPALEQSSQNDQRKQDVSAILQAVLHYELNNSGNIPECGYHGVSSCYGTGNLLQYTNLSYYNGNYGTNVEVQNGVIYPGTVPASPTNPNNSLENVYVYNYMVCNPNNPGTGTNLGAGYNSVVALYAVQSGSNNNTPECEQL